MTVAQFQTGQGKTLGGVALAKPSQRAKIEKKTWAANDLKAT